MKRTIFLLAISCLLTTLSITSCNNSGPDLTVKYDSLEAVTITDEDNRRAFYQIFPISFADSDGNGKGDLQGIIDKLDYIKDLNYGGIWLNPIHPSPSYHKYDVTNYMSIDADFGDLATFDTLVEEAHKRNIKIILDLVVNHSSNQHSWFTKSYQQAKTDMSGKYAQFYNWVNCTGSAPEGYSKVNSSDKIAYESRFVDSMPDLNLQQVLDNEEGDLATELKKIFSFWLVDHKVDGFRLDAVTSYFTGQQSKNLQFLTWLNKECKALKPNCYIVGEGSWGTNSIENQNYQESGVDSFFQFGNSIKNTGYAQQAVINSNAKGIFTALQRNNENAAGGIEAPFLGNHDVPRFVGGVQGRGSGFNTKFALGLLQVLRGASFTYYGDEIGMASQTTTSDGFYRLPMKWGDDYECKINKMGIIGVTASKVDEALSYPFASVKEQLSDSSSVLNYVKQANLMRAAFPEIAHGDFELALEVNKTQIIIKRTYQDSTIHVVINADISKNMVIDYTQYGEKVAFGLCAKNDVKYESEGSTNIVVPAHTIVIIK